jgi:hypothetical protein
MELQTCSESLIYIGKIKKLSFSTKEIWKSKKIYYVQVMFIEIFVL